MNDDKRPDPDALLARVLQDEQRDARGRLEVFLGMSPGVGKTYAMLESAQEDRRAGKNILAGIVETHGRVETEALLEGLTRLPRRKLEHRHIVLEEFDLDGALAARPELLLVDELAHTNAPGSRHAKRWQDVRELIEAGIDVRTTLNIQHVESLNDVVAQITGVRVRETVPDSILEQADEVVLVDLAPDELRERLDAGKVYLGAQAARAADGFFRPSNLVALREMALRFVASRVGRQVRFHRDAIGSSKIWPTQERVLVAVGPAPSSATLVRAAKRLAVMLGAEWFALSIETARGLRPEERRRVSEHLRLAESLGAKAANVTAASVPEGVLQFARGENVTKLVIGKPIHARWTELFRPSPVDLLIRESGDIDVYVIRGDEGAKESASKPRSARENKTQRPSLLLPIVANAAVVAVGSVLPSVVAITDIAMLFLIAGAGVGLVGSRLEALLTAVFSVLSLNFFFVPPLYTFRVAGPAYLLTFATLFGTSFGISEMTRRLRQGRDLARRSEERTAAVYRLSRRLAEARGAQTVALHALQALTNDFSGPLAISLRSANGGVSVQGGPLDEKEAAVVTWVLQSGLPAGRETGTLSSASMMHLPLVGPSGCLGVLSVGGDPGGPVRMELLHALSRHLALVLSVETLEEERRVASQEAQAERMRSSILGSVSHDLRTPLASILGSASSLKEQAELLDPATRDELLATINDEADRLNRLIANLLEMTKIEHGALRLNKVALPVDEVVGAGIRPVRRLLEKHTVTTNIPAELPFVEADELLVQQVLINLLENAAKHTPIGTEITIRAEASKEQVRITVSDKGPGFPQGVPAELFSRFYRGDSAAPGAGLGLAICKGIIEAHGGDIVARHRAGGGAEFSFTLPIAPAIIPPDDESHEVTS